MGLDFTCWVGWYNTGVNGLMSIWVWFWWFVMVCLCGCVILVAYCGLDAFCCLGGLSVVFVLGFMVVFGVGLGLVSLFGLNCRLGWVGLVVWCVWFWWVVLVLVVFLVGI